jgi:putative membrane protein
MTFSSDWKKPEFRTLNDCFRIFGCGMCMGAADVIPGVSGGTVAFVLGIYEDLVRSIASVNGKALGLLFRGKIGDFFASISWKFLALLLCGITVSFLSFAAMITKLLDMEVYRSWLYSLFMGLVLAAALFCVRQLSSFRIRYLFAFCIGAFCAWTLVSGKISLSTHEPLFGVPFEERMLSAEGLKKLAERTPANFDAESGIIQHVPKSFLPGMVARQFIDRSTLVWNHQESSFCPVGDLIGSSKPSIIDLWVMTCGMLAISAMLLPGGISGSYLLTILGMYSIILSALVDLASGLLHGTFDGNSFSIIFSMVCGIIIGAMLFSRVATWLFSRYRQIALATLVGFMIGALRSVWPFWSYQYQFMPLRLNEGPALVPVAPILPDFASWQFVCALCFFAAGFGYVLFIETIAAKRKTLHQ